MNISHEESPVGSTYSIVREVISYIVNLNRIRSRRFGYHPSHFHRFFVLIAYKNPEYQFSSFNLLTKSLHVRANVIYRVMGKNEGSIVIERCNRYAKQ